MAKRVCGVCGEPCTFLSGKQHYVPSKRVAQVKHSSIQKFVSEKTKLTGFQRQLVLLSCCFSLNLKGFMSFRKWSKFAYKNGVRGDRIKWCLYLQYKSSKEPMFGTFVHYFTWPMHDVSMNFIFCWPPSVDIFNILPAFLWQPLSRIFLPPCK